MTTFSNQQTPHAFYSSSFPLNTQQQQHPPPQQMQPPPPSHDGFPQLPASTLHHHQHQQHQLPLQPGASAAAPGWGFTPHAAEVSSLMAIDDDADDDYVPTAPQHQQQQSVATVADDDDNETIPSSEEEESLVATPTQRGNTALVNMSGVDDLATSVCIDHERQIYLTQEGAVLLQRMMQCVPPSVLIAACKRYGLHAFAQSLAARQPLLITDASHNTNKDGRTKDKEDKVEEEAERAKPMSSIAFFPTLGKRYRGQDSSAGSSPAVSPSKASQLSAPEILTHSAEEPPLKTHRVQHCSASPSFTPNQKLLHEQVAFDEMRSSSSSKLLDGAQSTAVPSRAAAFCFDASMDEEEAAAAVASVLRSNTISSPISKNRKKRARDNDATPTTEDS